MVGSNLWLSLHDWELELFLNLCHSFPFFISKKKEEKENRKEKKRNKPHVNKMLGKGTSIS